MQSAIEFSQSDPLSRVIQTAIELRASDIHIEKDYHDKSLVRFRIDGVLVVHAELSLAIDYVYSSVIATLKLRARMNIAEHRLPQDGRTSYAHHHIDYELRISTCPALSGERIVIRILRNQLLSSDCGKLGMTGEQIAKVEQAAHNPVGLVLATGPTGSGKSTTIHTILHQLLDSSRCILSVEDPVEYRHEKLAQVQVHAEIGLDFATVLRHFLRQDPDVIFVGEIRDVETAQIALRASLTGHLVLTSMHASGIGEALARLHEMKIPLWLIRAAPTLVLTQRLLRSCCLLCVDWDPNDRQRFLKCQCLGTKYHGRIGVFDVAVGAEIAHRFNVGDASTIQHEEQRSCQILQDAATKLVGQGITTKAEVLRILGTSTGYG